MKSYSFVPNCRGGSNSRLGLLKFERLCKPLIKMKTDQAKWELKFFY